MSSAMLERTGGPPVIYFFQSTFASHYIQIRSVDKENRKICYWSWGENREMQKTDDYTGVAELIIVKIK